MKKVFFLCSALLLLSALPWEPSAVISVMSKDIDGTPDGQNMRRLGFLLENQSDAPVNMADVVVEYELDDSAGTLLSTQIWQYVVHSADWSESGGSLDEVQVTFEREMALNMGQLLSIPFILFGIGLLIYVTRKKEEVSQAGTEK